MASSPLVHRIVSDIRQRIQLGALSAGAHLSAQKVADHYQVSRSPAREALTALAGLALLQQIPNRGFFVLAPHNAHASKVDCDAAILLEEPPAYYRLSEDWLNDAIPAEVTESHLQARYGLTRPQVSDILNRAARVGWAEPKPGYGWRLLDVAKTPQALEQIYRLRAVIEPAALLENGFVRDKTVLSRLKQEQRDLLAGGIHSLPADVLLKTGIRFHETLIELSGNPLYAMVLRQLNNMRRLIEYRSMVDRSRFHGQCTEHLRIVELVEAGDNVEAAELMKRHLSGSLARKSPMLALGLADDDLMSPRGPSAA